MPTYINTSLTESGSTTDPYVVLDPGESKALYKYAKNMSSNIELSSHEPIIQPWKLLEADGDGLIDVSGWENIIVYNAGDYAATISANTDDSNALTIAVNSKEFYSNTEGLFGCLEILTGSSVSVWGSR